MLMRRNICINNLKDAFPALRSRNQSPIDPPAKGKICLVARWPICTKLLRPGPTLFHSSLLHNPMHMLKVIRSHQEGIKNQNRLSKKGRLIRVGINKTHHLQSLPMQKVRGMSLTQTQPQPIKDVAVERVRRNNEVVASPQSQNQLVVARLLNYVRGWENITQDTYIS